MGRQSLIEEEVPETPSLLSSTLVGEGGEIREDYPNCYIEFDTPEGLCCTNVIPIVVIQKKLLVAVPAGAWSRSVNERYLPKTGLTKAFSVEVEGLEVPEGELAAEGAQHVPVRVWVGFLRNDLMRKGVVGEAEEPGVLDFGEETGTRVIPYARPLVELANDHFAFVSAASAPGEEVGAEKDVEARFQTIEAGLEAIRVSLADLPKAMSQQQAQQRPRSEAGQKKLPGLDPGVLASARQAGIEEDQLQKISHLLTRPNRMQEAAPTSNILGSRAQNVLSESEEEAEDEGDFARGEEGRDPQAAGSAVEKAVVQLTKLVTTIAKDKKPKTGLEAIFERIDGGGGESSGTALGGTRSKAAAYKKLKHLLSKNPELLYQSIEAQMEEDFHYSMTGPGNSNMAISSRAWLENRSRLTHYPSTIRSAWIVAGIHDALRRGAVAEARSRCCLALAAIDQSSIDSGSWMLSQEVLLEQPPPFASFQGTKPVDVAEQPATKLLDERFVEVVLWRLKERDSYLESRRRLVIPGKKPEPPIENPKGPPKPTPKVKAKGKGKGGEAKGSQPEEGGTREA